MCPNILFYISAVSILLLGPFLRFYFVNILYFFSLLLFHSSNVLLALLKLLQFSLCLAVSSISLPVLVSVCSLQLFSCDWFSSLISAVGPPASGRPSYMRMRKGRHAAAGMRAPCAAQLADRHGAKAAGHRKSLFPQGSSVVLGTQAKSSW